MIKKAVRFLNSPLNIKFIILKNLLKKILRVVLISITQKPISSLFSLKLGRDLLYSAMPDHELVLSTTEEGLLFITCTSDKVVGKSVFKHRKAYDSQHLIQSFKILNTDRKAVLLDIGANLGRYVCINIFLQ